MEERKEVIADYFKLQLLLNRTNKKPNERTEIKFVIRNLSLNKFQFVATLNESGEKPFVELCVYTEQFGWRAANVLGLVFLESYCVEQLKHYCIKLCYQSVPKLTERQKKSLCECINKDLRTLIIPKDQA